MKRCRACLLLCCAPGSAFLHNPPHRPLVPTPLCVVRDADRPPEFRIVENTDTHVKFSLKPAVAAEIKQEIPTLAEPQVDNSHTQSSGSREPQPQADGIEGTTQARTLVPLGDLRAGQQLTASVKEVNLYAAYLDCGVSRIGAGGKRMLVDGFLHKSDITQPYALASMARASKEGAQAIKKGAHITVYVKDIFINSGRYTLTLDSGMDKRTARLLRQKHRESSSFLRRTKRDSTNAEREFEAGEEIVGIVTRVTPKGLLVDVGTAALLKMPIATIREALGGSFIDNLREVVKPGQKVKGRAEFAAQESGASKVRLNFVSLAESE